MGVLLFRPSFSLTSFPSCLPDYIRGSCDLPSRPLLIRSTPGAAVSKLGQEHQSGLCPPAAERLRVERCGPSLCLTGFSSSSATWEEGLRRTEEGVGEEEEEEASGRWTQGDEASAAQADISVPRQIEFHRYDLCQYPCERLNNLPDRPPESALKVVLGPDCQPCGQDPGREGRGEARATGLPQVTGHRAQRHRCQEREKGTGVGTEMGEVLWERKKPKKQKQKNSQEKGGGVIFSSVSCESK